MAQDFVFFQSESDMGAGSTSPVIDAPVTVAPVAVKADAPAPVAPAFSAPAAKPIVTSTQPEIRPEIESVPVEEPAFIENMFADPEERIAAQEDEEESSLGKGVWVTVIVAFLAIVVLGVGAVQYFRKQAQIAKMPQAVAVAGQKVPRVVPALAQAEKLITAKDGGTINLGQFEVKIPAGALEKDTMISIELVAKADFSKFETTDFFRLLPEGIQFKKPVTVKVPYYVAGLRKGTTIEQSVLWFWHGGKVPRKSLAFTVDKSTKRLGAEVMGF